MGNVFNPTQHVLDKTVFTVPSGIGNIKNINLGSVAAFEYRRPLTRSAFISAIKDGGAVDTEFPIAANYCGTSVTDLKGVTYPAFSIGDGGVQGAFLSPVALPTVPAVVYPNGGKPYLDATGIQSTTGWRYPSRTQLGLKQFSIGFIGILAAPSAARTLFGNDALPAAGAGHGFRARVNTDGSLQVFTDTTNNVKAPAPATGVPMYTIMTFDQVNGIQIFYKRVKQTLTLTGAQNLSDMTVRDLCWHGSPTLTTSGAAFFSKWMEDDLIDISLGLAANASILSAWMDYGDEMIAAL